MGAMLFSEIKVNVPEIATKQLKLRTCNGLKRATLSSNWLMLFGFDGSQKVVEESLGDGKGIRVRLANPSDKNKKKVYQRVYNSRSANPLNPLKRRKERLIEIASQKLINSSLGKSCMHVHIVFKFGVLYFLPLEETQYKLIQNIDSNSKINTLVAMTGGVDCHVLEKNNFNVDTVISFRPNDSRDKSDYTEFDCMSTLVNSAPRVLVNEDIYKLNSNRLATLVGDTPITVGHFSLTCTDFSSLKTKKAKMDALENLTSTIDMFICMVNIISALAIPVIVIENVEGFSNHAANDILSLQLKRRGFKIHQRVYKSEQHGGLSLRKRMYLVATTLDAPIQLPEPDDSTNVNVWEDVILKHWDEIEQRDVTDTKVMKDAIESGRARVIDSTKTHSPAIARSQSQDPKDAVVVERNGRYYRLPVVVQKAINSIPETFDLDWAPLDKASQIIGQSICCSLHERIMASVRSHIIAAADKIRNNMHTSETNAA
ncbi:MAG: hypothetical protein CML20_14395 [Rheinheimera sp.]|nr:hypothetical protein [Rheinheimera sp.]|tara:strand:+ start:4258 stop:5715 length:1458 start_codon:yes stop_codon:yes gene_type:complete